MSNKRRNARRLFLRWNIIFILSVIRLSATEDVKNLNGTVGGNITLPDPVLERGFLLYKEKNIAHVDEGKFKTWEKTYTDRVHWNRNTGLFTLTGLQRKDSGIYIIDSKTGKIIFNSYNLTVYDPVQTPRVKRQNISCDSNITAFCGQDGTNSSSHDNRTHHMIWIVIGIIFVFFVILKLAAFMKTVS